MQYSLNKAWCSLIRLSGVLVLSTSIALGSPFSSFLTINAPDDIKTPPITLSVEGGTKAAQDYASQLAIDLAKRLTDQQLSGRIEIQSGYFYLRLLATERFSKNL